MDARMLEVFCESALDFMPDELEQRPQGGRRSTRHQTVLKVIWFALVTCCCLSRRRRNPQLLRSFLGCTKLAF